MAKILLLLIATLTGSWAIVHVFDDSLPIVRFRLLTTFLVLSWIQIAVYLFWTVIVKPLFLSPFKDLPKPPGGNWLNGHFREIMREGNGEIEVKWLREVPNDGIIHCRGLLNAERLIVSSPSALMQIATDNYTWIKPNAIKLLAGRVLGMGLVLSERDEHKQQRKLFLPPFAAKHIRELYPTFWEKSREVTDKMCEEIRVGNTDEKSLISNTATFEIGEWAARAALDIITLAAMGRDFGAVQDANSPLAKVYHTVLTPTMGHVVLALLKNYFPESLVEMLPLKSNRDQGAAYYTIRGVCRDLLRNKKEKLAGHTLDGKDILSVCLRYEEIAGVAEEEVIDQMTTILGAGHETISVGVTWAIYMLCLHRDWQTRLREEVRAHLPPLETRTLTASDADIEKMPLMRAFLEEVLRWYPPIPTTMREAISDTELDGRPVSKGTRIVIPIKAINREERYWGPEAKKFNPNRWLKDNGEFNSTGNVTSKYGHLSFMHGPRSCIASGFARAEMACVVAAWVGRLEFGLVEERYKDEAEMKTSNGNFSAKPLHGMYVRTRIVEGW